MHHLALDLGLRRAVEQSRGGEGERRLPGADVAGDADDLAGAHRERDVA